MSTTVTVDMTGVTAAYGCVTARKQDVDALANALYRKQRRGNLYFLGFIAAVALAAIVPVVLAHETRTRVAAVVALAFLAILAAGVSYLTWPSREPAEASALFLVEVRGAYGDAAFAALRPLASDLTAQSDDGRAVLALGRLGGAEAIIAAARAVNAGVVAVRNEAERIKKSHGDVVAFVTFVADQNLTAAAAHALASEMVRRAA